MAYQELLQQQQATQNALARLQSRNKAKGSGLLFAGAEQLSQPEQKSVLGIIDRFKYGFADDIGQQDIIFQKTGKKPVKLPNGQYGVEDISPNGQKVIRPVDPKGFQMGDLLGDIGESLGKTITAGGGAVGGGLGLLAGGVGSVAGAGAGAAGGELVRQQLGNLLGVRGTEITEGPNKGKFAKTQFGQLGDQNDFGEIAGEAILGAAGQGIALGLGKVMGGILKAGSGSGADDLVRAGLPDEKIAPKAIDALQDFSGMPKGKSKILLKEFLDGNVDIPHEMTIGDYRRRAGDKIIKMTENTQKILNEQFTKTLDAAGITDDTLVPLAKRGGQLADILDEFKAKAIRPSDRENLQVVLSEFGDTPLREIENVPYGSLQALKRTLDDIRPQTFIEGRATASTKYITKLRGLLSQTENALEPIKQAKAVYAPQIQASKKLSNLLNIKLEQGLAKEGRFTPETFINRLGTELQDRNLEKIIKYDDILASNPAFAGMSIKKDLLSSLLGSAVESKAPFTGGRLSASGIADSVGKAVFNPRRRLQMVKGLMNMGVLNKGNLGNEISTLAPKTTALVELVDARRLLDQGIPMPEVLKQVSKPVAKIIMQTAKNKGVQGQIVTRSLNQILYEGNGMNQ